VCHDCPVPRFPLYTIASWVFPPLVARRKRWYGLEHVPPGGFVVAANHVSSMDPFILGMPLWPPRVVRYMAKAELFTPWLGWAMRAIGTFPVRRGEADSGAFRTAVKILQDGEIVGMFPEGTRAKKGLRKKFTPAPHTGTARIALAAGVPLVPAAIAGTDRLLSRGRVSVAFGPPVELDDLAGVPRRQAAEIGTERLMAAIQSLVEQLAGIERAGVEPDRAPSSIDPSSGRQAVGGEE
jgi:1-acyl-sn-glycerol-3-phosphate acyltransferase